jgi:uncharacterized surface protein with fasciclin (FAS1) repeats
MITFILFICVEIGNSRSSRRPALIISKTIKLNKVRAIHIVVTSDVAANIFGVEIPRSVSSQATSKIGMIYKCPNTYSQDVWLLTEILSLHILPGKFEYKDLLKLCQPGQSKASILSIDSSPIEIDLSDGIRVGNSTVLSTDTSMTNGIVHLIDRIITPI